MDKITEPIIGAELKLNVNIEPIDDYHMDDYQFTAEFYTRPDKPIALVKNEMRRVDADHYLAAIDSTKLGTGMLKVQVTAYIPDDDFADGIRTEKAKIETDILISR